MRIYCLYLPSSRPQNLAAPMQTPHFAIHPMRPPAGQKNKIQLAVYRFNSRDMEMIYGSNESGKPILFARPDQQRSHSAFWIVNDRKCLDHKAAAQSSATSNIN